MESEKGRRGGRKVDCRRTEEMKMMKINCVMDELANRKGVFFSKWTSLNKFSCTYMRELERNFQLETKLIILFNLHIKVAVHAVFQSSEW